MTDTSHEAQLLSRRAELMARRAELMARLEGVEHDLDHSGNKDIEDQATEREDDEVLEGLGNAGLAELRKIEAALKRIEDGSYGTCAACHEAISEERLTAVPYATRCRLCA
ncbi:MAG: TraR/DksA C4-type zinc finger protein [Pseudomonadota bacterium]